MVSGLQSILKAVVLPPALAWSLCAIPAAAAGDAPAGMVVSGSPSTPGGPGAPWAAPVKSGVLGGQALTAEGAPLAGGTAYLFDAAAGPPPAHEKYWRVPEFKQQLDKEGKFSLVVPEGEYYLAVASRTSGRVAGPPREGDYYFASYDDAGHAIAYSVKSSAPLDLGRIAKARPFRSSTVNYGPGITAIEGVISDSAGNPVEGVCVFAFASAARGVRPLFASDATGKDGAFTLRVHDTGVYYLKVRNMNTSGPPAVGELFGIYGERQPEGVEVARGDRLTGISIKVNHFAGKGPQSGGRYFK